MPHYWPNYSQEEVNRQNSTSPTLFLPWEEEEMKAVEMTGKRQLNVSHHNSSLPLWCPKRFIYSSSEQNLSPLITENWIGQPNAEMHVTHTIWVHSFRCTSAQSQKKQSYPANDYSQAITEAEHPHACLSVHFVRNKIKYKNHAFKMGPRQKLCV